MKTIEIDIDQIKGPGEIRELIKKQKPQKGDEVKVATSLDADSLAFFAVVLVLIAALSWFFKKKANDEFVDGVEEDFFGKYSSAKEAEEDIEKQYGIKITMTQKDEEHHVFIKAGLENMSNAYGEDEPDYDDVAGEPNPDYKPW
ncbi:MAG: hypothetical protein WD077_10450 [Bacteroidia bacterium]